ncbi:hypothetical protein DSECCO2_503090 [anaerobic digester metagenome]
MAEFKSIDIEKVLIVDRTDLKEKYQETPVRKLPVDCFLNNEIYYKMSYANLALFKDTDGTITIIKYENGVF